MTQSDLDLLKRLRAELEAFKSEAAAWKTRAAQATRDIQQALHHLRQVIEINDELTAALRHYLEEDRKAVDAGQLETVAMRPAFAALGGKHSGLCSAHQRPSVTCRTCYPNPRKPRVTPAPVPTRQTPS